VPLSQAPVLTMRAQEIVAGSSSTNGTGNGTFQNSTVFSDLLRDKLADAVVAAGGDRNALLASFKDVSVSSIVFSKVACNDHACPSGYVTKGNAWNTTCNSGFCNEQPLAWADVACCEETTTRTVTLTTTSTATMTTTGANLTSKSSSIQTIDEDANSTLEGSHIALMIIAVCAPFCCLAMCCAVAKCIFFARRRRLQLESALPKPGGEGEAPHLRLALRSARTLDFKHGVEVYVGNCKCEDVHVPFAQRKGVWPFNEEVTDVVAALPPAVFEKIYLEAASGWLDIAVIVGSAKAVGSADFSAMRNQALLVDQDIVVVLEDKKPDYGNLALIDQVVLEDDVLSQEPVYGMLEDDVLSQGTYGI